MLGLASHPLSTPQPTAPSTNKLDRVTTFAKVPEPGHPFGVMPVGNVIYATTAAGNPTTVNTTGREKLLTYDRRGRLLHERPVTVASPNMGLNDIEQDAEGRLYVGDMNGRRSEGRR